MALRARWYLGFGISQCPSVYDFINLVGVTVSLGLDLHTFTRSEPLLLFGHNSHFELRRISTAFDSNRSSPKTIAMLSPIASDQLNTAWQKEVLLCGRTQPTWLGRLMRNYALHAALPIHSKERELQTIQPRVDIR